MRTVPPTGQVKTVSHYNGGLSSCMSKTKVQTGATLIWSACTCYCAVVCLTHNDTEVRGARKLFKSTRSWTTASSVKRARHFERRHISTNLHHQKETWIVLTWYPLQTDDSTCSGFDRTFKWRVICFNGFSQALQQLDYLYMQKQEITITPPSTTHLIRT